MLQPLIIYYITKSKSNMQGEHVLPETFDVCAKFQRKMTLSGFSIKIFEVRASDIVYRKGT